MKNKLDIKKVLLEKCFEFCNHKLDILHSQIEEINKALTSETKSSAGDKHETGRAMLHIEREKLGNQLLELQKLIEILLRIQLHNMSKTIKLGSLVYTSQSNYFIGISAGALKVGSELFYAVSKQSPIGELLFGACIGDVITFREQNFIIEEVI